MQLRAGSATTTLQFDKAAHGTRVSVPLKEQSHEKVGDIRPLDVSVGPN
jgi:hypothetical protein